MACFGINTGGVEACLRVRFMEILKHEARVCSWHLDLCLVLCICARTGRRQPAAPAAPVIINCPLYFGRPLTTKVTYSQGLNLTRTSAELHFLTYSLYQLPRAISHTDRRLVMKSLKL